MDRTIAQLLGIVYGIFSRMFFLLYFVAIGLFFFGLAKFLNSGGDETALKNGKNLMFWGIVGLVIISSIWGIVALLTSSFFGGSGFVIPFLPISYTHKKPKTIQWLLDASIGLVKGTLLSVAFGIGVLMFFFGLLKYVYSLTKEEKKEARFILTWGIIVMFLISSIWGVIKFVQGEFGIGGVTITQSINPFE